MSVFDAPRMLDDVDTPLGKTLSHMEDTSLPERGYSSDEDQISDSVDGRGSGDMVSIVGSWALEKKGGRELPDTSLPRIGDLTKSLQYSADLTRTLSPNTPHVMRFPHSEFASDRSSRLIGVMTDSFHYCRSLGRSRTFVGYTCLFLVVVLWVGSSVLIQRLFTLDLYAKPITITLVQIATSVVLLAPQFFSCIAGCFARPCFKAEHRDIVVSPNLRNDVSKPLDHLVDETSPYDVDNDSARTSSLIKLALPFSILWLGAQLTFNLSLYHISVPTNSVLSSTSIFFTFCLGLIFLRESFVCTILFAVCLTFLGVFLIVNDRPRVESSNDVADSFLGYFLAVISALTYALMTVLLKRAVIHYEQVHSTSLHAASWYRNSTYDNDAGDSPDKASLIEEDAETWEDQMHSSPSYKNPMKSYRDEDTGSFNMTQFFGYIGLIVLILTPAILAFCYILDLETDMTPSLQVIGFLLVNGLFGSAIPDLLWAKTVVLLTPLIATAAINIQIPVAIFVDSYFMDSHRFGWVYFLGCTFVVVGVLTIAITTNKARSSSVDVLPNEPSPRVVPK